MIYRKPEWRTKLIESIETHRRRPFSWETGADCAMFVADGVLAMTGVDLARGYRGSYYSASSALLKLQREGFDRLIDLVAHHFDEVHPSQANVGDIAAMVTDDEFGHSIGFVMGERVSVRAQRGIGSFPRDKIHKAFRVP